MKKTVLLFSILLSSILGNTQETIVISKDEVVSKVAEGNNTLKMFEKDLTAAKGELGQTNAVFLPNITASYSGMATTNPLMAFGSKLNQGILTQSDFDPQLLNNPSQIENFATKFEVQQPLLNLDGIHQRKAAKAKMYASQFQFSGYESKR
jgi:outer membrane protein TolC